jgi:hypothetical protein
VLANATAPALVVRHVMLASVEVLVAATPRTQLPATNVSKHLQGV